MNTSSTDNPVMYVSSMAVFLNRWYASYDHARAAREPGLDPLDPDWERIGWDWVRPLDTGAWQRLMTKREVAR